MKKLVFAAAVLASASTAAMADDPWVMNSNHTCPNSAIFARRYLSECSRNIRHRSDFRRLRVDYEFWGCRGRPLFATPTPTPGTRV